ncbi:MAG: aminomethyl-transferring glycine dehydrogenase subunit GcvPB, partial [Chloroflexi bacterium]|nr:aminomethyl-transferring glycine dehydrogenase subunit GcvPB [Chloroflexota bacterium]
MALIPDPIEATRALLMDRSQPGRVAVSLPALDVPQAPLPTEGLLRQDLPLPEVSEGELVRYFTHLSHLNYAVDTGFYPLGSCTMKYNPKWHDEAAALPGFTDLHPRQDPAQAQGALRLIWELQEALGEITGLPGCSTALAAGAQAELAGMLIIRAYLRARGEEGRKLVLVPDSAHGTNPASAAMAGFEVVTVRSNGDGNMDLPALRAATTSQVAGIMLTMPTTLGLFDPQVQEVCRIVHEAGGLVYGDGANLNAILGRAKFGELGFDIVHLNLHKTFSTPHGGGGPGAGVLCVRPELAPFLPAPVVARRDGDGGPFFAPEHPAQSIGRLHGAGGNFGILVRAYCYIRSLGEAGLREVSANAVLNANYLRARLRGAYRNPYDRPCMHEVVLSAVEQKARGVRALDIAKRLIDYGFHPPTIYFPLIVEEALMIEPTESESRETLDRFIAALLAIDRESRESPATVREAPRRAPVRRLDEATAAR